MSSFTALQQRCCDGLDREEGNSEHIATLEVALLDARAQAAESEAAYRSSLDAAQADLDAAKPIAARAEQAKSELAILSIRWREERGGRDGLRKRVRELQESVGAGARRRLLRYRWQYQWCRSALRTQLHDLRLDMASLESLQSDYASLQRQAEMSSHLLAEKQGTN